MGKFLWPAVWAVLATAGIVAIFPGVLGLFSKPLGKVVGRWLKRRALAFFGGLFVGNLVWWNFIRRS